MLQTENTPQHPVDKYKSWFGFECPRPAKSLLELVQQSPLQIEAGFVMCEPFSTVMVIETYSYSDAISTSLFKVFALRIVSVTPSFLCK